MSTEQPSALSLVSQPMIMHHSPSLAHRGQGIGCFPSRLVLGTDTLSPTVVGALSVAVHPDDGWCLSSCLLTLIPFIQAPHLTSPAKGQPNPRKSQVATLQRKSYMAIPPESLLWQHTKKVLYMANHGGSYVQILSRPLDPQGR